MQQTQVWSLRRDNPLEKEWQPTPVFLPGEFHGQRSLVGYSAWGPKTWTWLSDYQACRELLEFLSTWQLGIIWCAIVLVHFCWYQIIEGKIKAVSKRKKCGMEGSYQKSFHSSLKWPRDWSYIKEWFWSKNSLHLSCLQRPILQNCVLKCEFKMFQKYKIFCRSNQNEKIQVLRNYTFLNTHCFQIKRII